LCKKIYKHNFVKKYNNFNKIYIFAFLLQKYSFLLTPKMFLCYTFHTDNELKLAWPSKLIVAVQHELA